MGYYATYNGYIDCATEPPEEVLDKLKTNFDNVYLDDGELTFCGEDKYHSDYTTECLNTILPYAKAGEVSYAGEDETFWRFRYKDGEWIEESAELVFEPNQIRNKENQKEFIEQIIGIFQDVLVDRKNKGRTYLSDKLTDLMKEWKVFR